MNKKMRSARNFKRPLFISSVLLVCIFSIITFLTHNKYKILELNSDTSGIISGDDFAKKTQNRSVQKKSLSSPQHRDTINSISTSRVISTDGQSDKFGDVNTSLPVSENTVDVKKESMVSEIIGILTHQTKRSNLSAEESAKKLSILLDNAFSLKDRREAAWILAKYGDAETLSTLKKIIADQTIAPDLKIAIIEGIGYSDDPQKKDVLLSVLTDQNENLVCAAIQGLAAIGDEDCVRVLSDIAISQNASINVASEAIIGLGEIPLPQAYQSLVDLYNRSTAQGESDSLNKIISAMGQRDIAETGQFFDQILSQAQGYPELRLVVAQALEGAQGDVSPFLINMLYDNDSEVRSAAAWTLASCQESGDIFEDVKLALANESDAEVRKRLYQAIGNQESIDIDAVAHFILNESDPEAKSAGYDLLANNIYYSENTDLKVLFDTVIVPELKETALSADKLNSRIGAIISLRRANTEQSYRALEEIATQSQDDRVAQATGIFE